MYLCHHKPITIIITITTCGQEGPGKGKGGHLRDFRLLPVTPSGDFFECP